MAKYLDNVGLSYFWGRLKTYFTKKGTSTRTAGHVVTWGSDDYTLEDGGYTIAKSVPADAVFTDTTYSNATTSSAGLMSQYDKTAVNLLQSIFEASTTFDGVILEPSLIEGNKSIVHYGVCSVSASTAVKTVYLSSGAGFDLVTGAWIAVKFSNTNTAAVGNLKLNVDSTGEKSIKYRNSTLPSAGTLASNHIYFFVYDGTDWEIVGDLDTSVTPSSSTPVMDGTGAVGTSTDYARADHVHPSDTTKVDKVTGKGLSTNDYTTAEKTKLSGIAEGAEVNQNAYSAFHVYNGTTEQGTWTAGSKSTTLKLVADQCLQFYASGNDPNTLGIMLKTSPALPGAPTATTAPAGTNTAQIATTAFVQTAISSAVSGAATFKGAISSNTAISGLSDYKAGWYWLVSTAGTYVGQTCEVGDLIYCISDRGSAYAAADFTVVQNNLDLAAITTAEIDTIVAS